MEILFGVLALIAATIVAVSITLRANRRVREFRPETHRSFAHEYLEHLKNPGGGER